MSQRVNSAVILAAGYGRRMWPFNEVRNKAAIPVANVPNVRRLADSLHGLGVSRIVVVVGHWGASVRHALHGALPEIVYVEQPAGGGTAGAALAGIRALDAERFAIIYGDLATPENNLGRLLDAATDAQAAVLVDPMPPGEGSLWYSAEVDGGRLIGVTGHDADATLRLCGAFVLDRSIVPALESNPGLMTRVPVGGMPPSEPDLTQSLNDWRADVGAVTAMDFAVDMDKPWHILEANRKMAAHETGRQTENRIDPTARIHDGAEITGFVSLGPNSELGNRTLVRGNIVAGANTRIVNGAILQGSAIIGDDTRISDYCLIDGESVIGSRCVVGHGAEMDGVMFDGSYLYHYCEISGVVGASVDIGAATVCGTLRFDDAPAEHRTQVRPERPVQGANATYFGDYSRTGVNVITMPGVKIGAYSCVGGGIVVYEDIPSRTLRLLKQETVDRSWGPERYGW